MSRETVHTTMHILSGEGRGGGYTVIATCLVQGMIFDIGSPTVLNPGLNAMQEISMGG